MYICSNRHDEVCYDGSGCPVCNAITSFKSTENDYEETIDILKSEIKELQEEVSALEFKNLEMCKERNIV